MATRERQQWEHKEGNVDCLGSYCPVKAINVKFVLFPVMLIRIGAAMQYVLANISGKKPW